LTGTETASELEVMPFPEFEASWVPMLLDMLNHEDARLIDAARALRMVRTRYRGPKTKRKPVKVKRRSPAALRVPVGGKVWRYEPTRSGSDTRRWYEKVKVGPKKWRRTGRSMADEP
jgi:hypothetical protein